MKELGWRIIILQCPRASSYMARVLLDQSFIGNPSLITTSAHALECVRAVAPEGSGGAFLTQQLFSFVSAAAKPDMLHKKFTMLCPH
jgi:hypothetical protein